MPRFWCHICNSYVHVNEGNMTCLTCGQEFIEAVDEPETAPQPQPNAFPNMRQGFQQGPRAGPYSIHDIFAMLNNPMAQGPMNGGPPPYTQGQAQPPFMFAFNPPMQQMPHVHAHHMPRAGPQGAPQPMMFQFPFGPVFNVTADAGSLQGMLGALFGGAGQFGDYVPDAAMNSLLHRLFMQHQSRQVPAAKTFLDTVPTIKFTEETATGECAICKCDWAKDDEGVDLPCHHYFHKDCLKQWFQTSNLCPMCRHEMPTDDPEYEKARKERDAAKQAEKEGKTPSDAASTGTTAPQPSSSSETTSTATNTTSQQRPSSSSSSNNAGNERPLQSPQDMLLDALIGLSSESESESMDVDDSIYEDAEDDDEEESSMDYEGMPTLVPNRPGASRNAPNNSTSPTNRQNGSAEASQAPKPNEFLDVD